MVFTLKCFQSKASISIRQVSTYTMLSSEKLWLLVIFKSMYVSGWSREKAKGEEMKTCIYLKRKKRWRLKTERICLRESVAEPRIDARCSKSVTIHLNINLAERCFPSKSVFISPFWIIFWLSFFLFSEGYLKNGVGSFKQKSNTEESKHWDICLGSDLPWLRRAALVLIIRQ